MVCEPTCQVLAHEADACVLSIENNIPNLDGPALEFLPKSPTLNFRKSSIGTNPAEAADPLIESIDMCMLKFKQNSDAFSIVSSSF